jgi:hypothetical protein
MFVANWRRNLFCDKYTNLSTLIKVLSALDVTGLCVGDVKIWTWGGKASQVTRGHEVKR